MATFEIIKPGTLSPGETAWEVMEQSQLYGEKPVRIVVSSECIRTVTSLALTKPKEFKEFWKVSSNLILKVSWCPDLCVLYILYLSSQDSTVEVTKVFFAEHIVGKRIMQHYKKIKPATVLLSPGRKTKPSKKNVTTVTNEEDRLSPLLSTSFRLKTSLNQEKFWRALILADYAVCREIFFGISPSGIRIVAPETLDPELVISLLCVSELKFYTYLGSPTLGLKFFQDGSNASKIKKVKFHVLPVTGQEMLRWYEYCQNFGDIRESLRNLPIVKPEEDLEDRVGDLPVMLKKDDDDKGMLRIRSADNIPSSNQPLKPANRKELTSTNKLSKSSKNNNSSSANENRLNVSQKSKSASMKPQLSKSKSFVHNGRF